MGYGGGPGGENGHAGGPGPHARVDRLTQLGPRAGCGPRRLRVHACAGLGGTAGRQAQQKGLAVSPSRLGRDWRP